MTAMNVRADEPKPAGLDEALTAIVRRFRADSGTVHFLQPDGLLHLAAATAGLPAAVLATIATIPVGKGMAGLAGARATGLGGAVVVPIFRDEAIVGALGIGTRSERAFTDAEMQDLIAAGRQLP